MITNLEHGNTSVKINDLGFIIHWSSNSLVSESRPIYLVLFEEYSRINPFCQSLDMSRPIQITSIRGDRLTYEKEIDEFFFEHEIQVTENGINYLISFDPTCTNHRIGLAMPYYENWKDFSQRRIEKEVANYSSFMHKNLYPDQHVLDIPCIYTENTAIFGDIKDDYQFFRYREGNFPWLRITASTAIPREDPLKMCVSTDVDDIKESYLSHFPEANSFLNKWKERLEELGKTFGIEIICQQAAYETEHAAYVSKSLPTEKDLERFYAVLKRELEKYPSSFFPDLDIKYLQLTMDLWEKVDGELKKIDGRLIASGETGIIIDIQSATTTIHHEIFHGIQRKKKFFGMPGMISQISGTVQITGISEYLAELFAMLMTNAGKAYSPTSGVLIEQIYYLKEEIKDFVSFPDLSSDVEDRTILAMTPDGIREIEFGDIHETAMRYICEEKSCQSS